MKNVVVLTGAGVSADSGVPTFRDVDGLWTKYDVNEVCTHEAYLRNRAKVIDFMNMLRRGMKGKQPNAAHYAIRDLEQYYNVTVVTTNIDRLHEMAGSTNILHLHGDLDNLRSERDDNSRLIPLNGAEETLDARHPDTGDLLRPNVVLFQEAVPLIADAEEIVSRADIMIVVGTSLAVYPSAGLTMSLPRGAELYYVDPGEVSSDSQMLLRNMTEHLQGKAAEMVPLLVERLKKRALVK